MTDFSPREGGYFTERGGRVDLDALACDVSAGLDLRVGHQSDANKATGVLYRWDGYESLWRPALPVLQERIRLAAVGRWTERLEKEVLGYLIRGAAALSPPKVGLVAFRNVVVHDDDIGSWTPRMPEYDPEMEAWNYWYSGDWTAYIPHNVFVPDQFASEDEFQEAMERGTTRTSAFLQDVLPADAQEFAWEMIGYFMTSRRIDRKALLLRGEGQNGKSRLLQLIENLLGKDNVSHLPLQTINKTSSPELEGLRDKLANIVDDMGTQAGRDISNFKTAVTGGKITVNPKWQHPYEFEPRAKFAFAVNRLLHSPDTSAAWVSRWVIVPFDITIPASRQIPADVLDAQLLAEAPWICTRAMHALQRLIARGRFDVPPSFDDAQDEFEQASNPVMAWVRDGGALLDGSAKVKGIDLLGAFKASAHGSAFRQMSARAFYEMLRSIDGVDARVSTGHAIWVKGLKLPASLADEMWENR